MYHVISSLVFAYMLLHLSDLSYISRFVSHTFTRTAREREREGRGERVVLSSQDCHLKYLTVGNSIGDGVKIIGSRIVQLLYRKL